MPRKAMGQTIKHLGDLTPDPKNARKHNPRNVGMIESALRELGAGRSILIDAKGEIIAGNGVVEAAAAAGIERVRVVDTDGHELIAVRRSDLKGKAKRRMALVDNRAGELAEWNLDVLRDLGEDDIAGLWSDGEMADLLGDEPKGGLTDPDDVPEPPEVPVTQPGDLWRLGKHRVLCGDATKADDVARVMGGEKAVLMATDPPYGVAYDNAERPNPGVAKPRVANDELTSGPAMQKFLEAMLQAAGPHMDAHAAFYFWHPMLTQGTYVAAAAAAAGILIHRQIIWVKPGLLLGRGDYHWRHELCFYGWRQGNRPPFYGPRNQDTIWEVGNVSPAERKAMDHATPKPVGLWGKPLKNHTRTGEVAYEPFLGSGTTLIAAEQLGRRCFGLEIEPKYVDVTVRRWEEFTGKKATLEKRDGKAA